MTVVASSMARGDGLGVPGLLAQLVGGHEQLGEHVAGGRGLLAVVRLVTHQLGDDVVDPVLVDGLDQQVAHVVEGVAHALLGEGIGQVGPVLGRPLGHLVEHLLGLGVEPGQERRLDLGDELVGQGLVLPADVQGPALPLVHDVVGGEEPVQQLPGLGRPVIQRVADRDLLRGDFVQLVVALIVHGGLTLLSPDG